MKRILKIPADRCVKKLTTILIFFAILAGLGGLFIQNVLAKMTIQGPATDISSVTVAGCISADQFQNVLDEFTTQTGISVEYKDGWCYYQDYIGCESSGTCPDVGIIPNPGWLSEFANAGRISDLNSFINMTELSTNYASTWIDLAKVDDSLFGIWFITHNKSLIWYDPTEFSSHSWNIADSWSGILTLSDQILSTTSTPPWSIGNESGEASGWPITDWFENILLRSAGPQIYDNLVAHTIPWTHPQILEAMTYFGDIFGNDAYQLGGKSGTVNTFFIEALLSPFQESPEAYLVNQGSFASGMIADHFPAQVAGTDFAPFDFPDINPTYQNAVMGAGDLAIIFEPTSEAQSLINFLITTDAAEAWISEGGISPNRSVDFNLYTDPNLRFAAQKLANADIFRFDLTDQLSSELNIYVWSQMDDLVMAAPNPEAMKTVLERIEIYASRQENPYQWEQSNADGFGDNNNTQIPALEVFNDQLYAGVWKYNPVGNPSSEVWRTPDGVAWELVNSQNDNGCADLVVYDGYLYCGSWNGWVWRTTDGENWSEPIQIGDDEGDGIAHFAVYDGILYASTWTDQGTKLWRTTNGDDWIQFGLAGFDGTTANGGAISSEIYNDKLYWGLGNWSTGAQLWYTDGNKLTQVINDGFGTIENGAVSSLAAFDGKLYAGLLSDSNIEVWRSDNDVDWEMVFSANDVGTAHNISGMEVYKGFLYLFAQNDGEGMEVWRTSDGEYWEPTAFNGFGDPGNQWTYWDNGNVVFKNQLFVSTNNWATGGEVWMHSLYSIFLPLILK